MRGFVPRMQLCEFAIRCTNTAISDRHPWCADIVNDVRFPMRFSAICHSIGWCTKLMLSTRDCAVAEFWSLLGNPPPGVTLNLVRAANSDRHAFACPYLHVAVSVPACKNPVGCPQMHACNASNPLSCAHACEQLSKIVFSVLHKSAFSVVVDFRWTKGMEDKLQQAADEAAAGGADKGTLKLHTLPDAGHWLHVDNPDGLLDMVSSGCQDAAANRRQ